MAETGIEIDEANSPVRSSKKAGDSVPTPSTVVSDDNDSVGSSHSGGSKNKKKKPRAEYQKQIDSLKEEKELLQKESQEFKGKYTILLNWAMNPPVPGASPKTPNLDAAQEQSEDGDVEPVPVVHRGRFRKKPRAEYQAEIDALLLDTNRLKDGIQRIKDDMKAIKDWSKKCPV